MKHITHGDSSLCPDVQAGRATRCPGHDVLDVPERAREHLRHAIMVLDNMNDLLTHSIPRNELPALWREATRSVRDRIHKALAAIEEGNP